MFTSDHRWFVLLTFFWFAIGVDVGTANADDVQVNSYTQNDQDTASVALDADGDFVVVWTSRGSGGTDSSLDSVQGQRYASDGSAVGGEFQVNTYTPGRQEDPSVSMDADGDFVVVWESDGSAGTDNSSFSVQAQRYASDGSAVGGEFQVNTYTTSYQFRPSVSMDADGDFVVMWESTGSGGTDSSNISIQGQRYASDGSTLGSQFQVNTYTTSSQQAVSVSVDADGDFVAVWHSRGSSGTDTSVTSVQGQLYASDGSAIGGEFQINTLTGGEQEFPSVSMDTDGDFVAVWYSDGSSGTDISDFSIQGQRYAADGSAIGGEFQVNTYTTEVQIRPSVSLDADGDFVVVWDSLGSSGTDTSIFSIQGQRFASDGSTIGDQFQVNTYTSGYQDCPSVSLDADGDFVVVWQSDGSGGTDTSGESIQRSDVATVPVELMSFSIE